ncbi:N-acetylneuraminate synthase [Pacificibacter marinus]|uniref:N-acetylneuraminate synthase n=1 Tax=Pacificibacter marinus TaxID=658057 RepID=UPI001C075FEC|nr:N-acetylneuraminate synthase [Pacificibacter marinus]MBU2868064.1 N-acetylneuraminate synthase [Pacificibacter marinus]
MTHSDPTYVIAEIGVNHNGDVGLAKQMIDVAADAGADAVKFQTFFADELVTRSAKKAAYQLATTDTAQSQYDMLKALELTADEFADLNTYCVAKNIAFLSTPFSFRAVDLLDDVGVHAFKVSSGDLTYVQMLDHMARKGKPVILSTGMGTLSEIEDAVRTIEAAGNTQISILHCVSNYPAAAEDCNLAAMNTIGAAFGYPVGWSDHTQGAAMSLAAVARGAKIIEKHITLDVTMDGPDHSASMMPDEFAQMMRDIRNIEIAIGTGVKRPTTAELNTAEVARRSLTVARDMKAGEILSDDDIAILRPGTGLQPKQLPMVLGQRLAVDIVHGTPLMMTHFDARS